MEIEFVCLFCGVGCKVSFKVKDNKVKYVEGINGFVNEGCFCVKGCFGFDYIYYKYCLIVFLICCDDVFVKGLNVDFGDFLIYFCEVMWEEVMDLVVKGLIKLCDEDFKLVVGFGLVKCINEEVYFF